MQVAKNEATGIWHLIGTRGCGADPDGDPFEDTWAMIRDRVDRDSDDKCSNCNWPRSR
jgi:hypothetical protein